MLTSFLSNESIFFTILGYQMSHIEFWGTILSVLAVWLSAQGNIWSWGIGMVSVVLYFFLFYQIQLYPDMFLQLFFFVTNAIGWWTWANPENGNSDMKNELKITKIEKDKFLIIICLALFGTALMGFSASNLNHWLPNLFSKPSAFPYLDSFTTVLSIFATFLMINKKVECWWVWLAIDLISTYIYFQKGVKFVSLIYFFYCFIALYGAINWTKQFNLQNLKSH